jgi:hypothetical protein
MQLQESFADQKAQPKEQWVTLVAEILLEPIRDIDKGILNDIGSVDARLQAAVEAQFHHAAQARTVQGQERIDGALIAAARPLEKLR